MTAMSTTDYTRRKFLETITGATLGSLGSGLFLTSNAQTGESSNAFHSIPKGATILFQGDSITDAGRDKDNKRSNDPWALGVGYAFLASAHLRHSMPGHSLECYNRGISGNKVFQLADRWQEDCLHLQPDLLSILVGVNDFWHTIDLDYDGTVELYENDYRALLKRTKEELPEVQLVIGEPFAVREGTAINDNWYPEFDRYREAAKRVARDFDAAFIPYQSIFDEAGKQVPGTYWTADGVHPTIAGSQLMAKAWLETVKRID